MSLFKEGMSAIGVLLGLTSYLLERALYRVGSLTMPYLLLTTPTSFLEVAFINFFFLSNSNFKFVFPVDKS